MSDATYIPTPWKQRWSHFRYSVLPGVAFCLIGGATLCLWGYQGGCPQATGELEAVRAEVAAPADGLLLSLRSEPWTLLEQVERNQIVAQLDDRPIRAQLATVTEELARLRKELEAATVRLTVTEADRVRGYLTDATRLRAELEQRRLAVLEHEVQVAVASLEVERTTVKLESLKPMYAKKMIPDVQITEAKLLCDEAAKRLEDGQKLLAESKTQKKDADDRWNQLPELRPTDLATELSPIAAAAEVQQSRVRELELAIQRLVIRSPLGGMIAAIHHWPGESVRAGEPILAVASQEGRYIVCYVRQEQRFEPKPGMTAEVRLRASLGQSYASTIERIGAQVEPIPLHQCRDPKTPEWGLPIRLAVPASFPARPGQLLEVCFKSTKGG